MKEVTKRKLLLAISECDPHAFRAVEIASALGTSRASTSQSVKALLHEGLIKEKDGKTLSITKKGEAKLEKECDNFNKLTDAIAEGYHLSPLEARKMARSLLEGTY